MSCFIQDLHLKFHSFLDFFRHGGGSSVKETMLLSATLPWAIGLKNVWFLIGLLLCPKSVILGFQYFFNPRDLCLPKEFLRGSWQKRSVSTYLTWFWKRNWVASMIESIIIFNSSYFSDDMEIFWRTSSLTFPWNCSTEFSQSRKYFRKKLRNHKSLRLLTEVNGAIIGFRSSSWD